ncbi:glycoside hydrolase family 2 TIM barrel-domain containing protein [Parabacteroides faecis]|uniref:Beta-galactosidase n=1 Tax=Parabacteroides faecis TaxID=1217282 RepID=A0ABR6KHX4_9BACT|nr:glycoside hydrolase family 2 TIM barrel-domain containing protein [Parabacteroides faecis]MBB4621055.1 beta-galactosidase [Parabacteroides faecis]
MRNILYTCLFLFCCFSMTGKVPSKQKIRLTENWEYLKGDLGGIWEAVRPASPGNPETVPVWQKVTLPHCFNAEDAVDPDVNYYQGPGWYKTLLTIDNPYADGRIVLDFEGAGQKTKVYIYTTLVGEHVGGYDEWSVDITEAVNSFMADGQLMKRFKGKIPLSVRCDNSRDLEMIPSDLSDFNLYGGLYRYLNLVYLPKASFELIRLEPVLSADRKEGTVKVKASFYNPEDIRKANVTVAIYDAEHKQIYSQTVQNILPLGNQLLAEARIKNPALWDVDSPVLYTCELTIDAGGQTLATEERFGFRQFEFKEKGPFFLNGRRLLLRGTHRHEDHAGVAQAMTEEMMRTEMQMMKDMGVNFIRLGHYQQSDIILRLCDELGILVWEEEPWCRGGLGGETYKEQARRMLTNMIDQHHNHPSVIIWGLGNENDWPNDFSTFDKGAIRAFMKEQHDLAHRLDDTRMTAIRRCEFCSDIVDVYSPSIWAGWYRGVFTDYKSVSEEEMKKVKHFLHVEWGGDSHARRHSENVFANLKGIESGKGADERDGDASLYGGAARASKDGDWSESYIVRLIDWHLKEQETMPWLTGAAYWPFKDFSTPVRPENPVPYVNQKGVVERDFTPKESYYVFQSYWTTEPMVHIYGHSWPVRWGNKGDRKEILVYSNCEAVELFVNGVSQGIKKRDSQDYPAAGLRWNCVYEEGKNEIRAVAVKGKTKVTDEIVQEYQTAKWGKEAVATLSVVSREGDTVLLEVQLLDKEGVRCLDSKKYIEFEIAGDGLLIQNQGTSTGSRKVQAYNGRACIKVNLNKGKSMVAVKAEGIPTAFMELM